jgi:8-oxo-dGTP pyrophosphatase MutT (NUDIX family)
MGQAKVTDEELIYRPLVAFDFDGVLHEHRGWVSKFGRINVEPLRMAQRKGYATAVMTCNDVGRVATILRVKYNLRTVPDLQMRNMGWDGGKDGRQVLVTNRKLAARMYVDDRAFHWTYGSDPGRIFDELDRRDGYKGCVAGAKRHWGPDGAAGVVPFAVHLGVPFVLLGQRSKNVQNAGTWGGFGGAIDPGDGDAWAAAQRECWEEAHVRVERWVYETFSECKCGWKYTTFLAEVPAGTMPKLVGFSAAWETATMSWVKLEDVEGYDLHPGMRESWPELRAEIENAAASRQETVA